MIKKFVLAILAAVMIPVSGFAATITVGTGATYSTIADGFAAATTGDTIELWSNMTESLAVASAKYLNYTSKAGNVFTWNSTEDTATLSIAANYVGDTPVLISNILFDHSVGAANTIELNGTTINATFQNCTFLRTSTDATANKNACIRILGNASNNTFRECKIVGGGATNIYGFYKGASNKPPTLGSTLKNTLIFGFASKNAVYIYDEGVQSYSFTNCTFAKNAVGYYDVFTAKNGCTTYRTNCLFVNNTMDIYIPDTKTYALLMARTAYSVFCQNIQSGSWGVGVQQNINSINEVVNVYSDFNLKVGAKSIDSGTNGGAPLVDLLGNVRPNNGKTDIGAYEYYSGVSTSTPIQTQTYIATYTSTPVVTPIATQTHVIFNIVKSASTLVAVYGNTLTYTIAYTNPSANEIPAISIYDSIPANFDYIDSDSGGVTDGGTPNVVSWSLTNIPAGGTGEVKFRVKVARYP